VVLIFLATSASATETMRRIDERFAEIKQGSDGDTAATDEVPDFRKHVVPLLGRLGCNGRACHGSFQGQGGFRLSLFGYDFKADYEALAKGDKPRANIENPLESLILRKPTLAIDHEGDKRYEKNGWEYRVLHRWIAAGAKPMADSAPDLKRLEITPREIVFANTSESIQLKVVAFWSDDTSEDVTALCRFRTNDDSVAKIDPAGKVSAAGVGDTHVVAFYDNGVAPIPVLNPVSDQVNERYPDVPAPTKIDELVVAKLRKLGIVPSGLSTDEEFLRRVSLDITGTLPPPAEVLAFAADQSPDKRDKKIDELLERPAYAAWWSTRLCDLTGNNPATMRQQLAPAPVEWYRWIQKRIADNTPYDKIVEGLVTAVSRRPDQSFEEFCKEMAGYYAPEKNGDFTDRASMPHYWARQNFRTPDERVMGFAYSFMGIQIQCAQCHKHPFDQWTKDDFDQFKPFFARVRYGVAPGTKDESDKLLVALGVEPDPKKRKNNNQVQNDLRKLAAEGKVVPHQEVFVTRPNQPAQRPKGEKGRNREPAAQYGKLLGGDKLDLAKYDDPRTALIEWLKSDPRRFMARAFVNRVWASYFNVGIIHPTDDMNLANPPSNAELLDYLAAGFVEHQYDMKWLHREICRSRTYQLSWRPNDTNKLDTRNFSRAVPRRLPAEVAYDAVVMATAGDEELSKLADNDKDRAIGLANLNGLQRGGGGANAKAAYALAVFGRPARATNCDCERSVEPSLLQTIYLQNDQETLSFIERAGGWQKQTEQALLSIAEKSRVKATPASFAKPKDEAASAADESGGNRGRRLDKLDLSQLERRLKRAKESPEENKALIEKIERRIRKLREAKQEEPKAPEKAVAEEKESAPATKPPIDAEKLNEAIRSAYLRTVSRLPDQQELDRARRHIDEAPALGAGLRDLMWALINTKEFIVNH
jgi:hypothetical protein